MAYSKIGLHTAANCGGCNGLPTYWQQLNAAGIPFTAYSANDPGLIVQAAAYQHAALVYRDVEASTVNPADYNIDPEIAAAAYWQRTLDRTPPEIKALKSRCWIELLNEPGKEGSQANWVGRLMYYMALKAIQDGYRIMGPGWSPGTPEPEHWLEPGWELYLRLCAAHPDSVALSLHEYSLSNDIHNIEPWLIGRYRFVLDACDEFGIAPPRIWISECGWTLNSMPPDEQAKADIAYLAGLYAAHPTIQAAQLWTLQAGAGNGNLPQRLNALLPWLTTYTIEARFPDLDPPPVEPPTPPVEPPVMSTQLLINPSFDDGWTDDDEYPATQQNPNGWDVRWELDAVSERSGAKFLLGEGVHRDVFPPHELGVLKWDGQFSYKLFAAYRPIWARLKQALTLPAGQYRLRTPVYVDCYHWKGYKDFALDPLHCEMMVKANGATVRDWTLLTPGQRNETETVIDHAGGVLDLAVHFRAHWGIANNGFFVDGWSLSPVTAAPPVEPGPGKWKSIIFKLPQDVTVAEVAAAVDYITPKRRTLTFSHDDLTRLLTGGNSDSYAEIAYPNRQQEVVALVEELGYQWVVPAGFSDSPLIADTFRSPVGTAEERERGDLWAGG